MERASYAATMLLCSDGPLVWPDIASTFTDCFSDNQDAPGAASALANGGCLIRYYTHSAQCLKQVTRTLWATARCALLDSPPLELR